MTTQPHDHIVKSYDDEQRRLLDETNRIFTAPRDKRTQDYITGRFG